MAVEISGIAAFLVIVVSVYLFINYLRKPDEVEVLDSFSKNDVTEKYVIQFDLENNMNEEIELDLLHLDKHDIGYIFKVSNGNYEMLVEYFKARSLNISSTIVTYPESKDWQKDIIYTKNYNPFYMNRKPVFAGFHNYGSRQYQKNVIASNTKYIFDYFNSLIVKLAPKQKKSICLVSHEDFDDNYFNQEDFVKCAFSIKNNKNTTQTVKLFDKEYYTGIIDDMCYKSKEEYDAGNKDIEITSLFDKNSNGYLDVIHHYETNPLMVDKIKIYVGEKNSNSKVKMNFDEHKISDLITQHQYMTDAVEVNLDNEFVAHFEIEVEPNSEILISFN